MGNQLRALIDKINIQNLKLKKKINLKKKIW